MSYQLEKLTNVNLVINEQNQIEIVSNKSKKWKTSTKVLMGAVTLVGVLGLALLSYLHFSGLGITQAGFTALGGKIAAFWHSSYNLKTGQILYEVVAPVVYGVIVISVSAYYLSKYVEKGNEIQRKKDEKELNKLREFQRRVNLSVN